MKKRLAKFGRPQNTDYATKEAFNSLRTNLKFCGDEIRVVALTSCTENEGKSTTALNLAFSFTEDGKKVLLIDADLRKSVFIGANKLRADGQIMGLSHYLSGQCLLEDVVYQTDVKGLDLVVAGPTAPNPTELLGGERFEALIEKAREGYDMVIIDSPPLGMVIDTVVMAHCCDGAILVIESDMISYRYAMEVKKQLEFADCRILGTVLNKVDMGGGKYYKGYYKGYYKKGEYGAYK